MSAHRVLVAGAGVAGLEAALALRALAGDRVTVELISPEPVFTYRPTAVAEPFRKGEVRRFPLERLVVATGARYHHNVLAAVESDEKMARLNSGETVEYGTLIVAVGARPVEAVPGALTFRGSEDGAALAALLERALVGEVRRIAFVVPTDVSWPLPLYELALLTSEFLVEHMTRGVELLVMTAEERPLSLFGEAASESVANLLTRRGIRLEVGRHALAFHDGLVRLADEETALAADAVVALPRLRGRGIEGLPQDERGFVATDRFGRVDGLSDVYAVGDMTHARIKQGGVAAQQADAAASAIAAELGAPVQPIPAQPVLRGLLLTGTVPQYLRSESGTTEMSSQPLWWPPAKLVGRYLSPFLADQLGLARDELHRPDSKIAIEVAVDLHAHTSV